MSKATMTTAAKTTASTTATRQIGWIGLGKMGLPMARNLATAGYAIRAHNRTREKAERLAHDFDGVNVAETPAAAADGCELVLSMTSDDDALQAVTLGPGGILEAAAPGAVFVDMSTVSPMASGRVATALAANEIGYLRAPVSGSTPVAEKGELKIWASGPQSALDTARDALDVVGGEIIWLGEDEQARYMKLAVNLQLGVIVGLLSEALAFGVKGGIAWDQLLDGIGDSPAASPLVKMKVPYLKRRDFEPTFSVQQMGKDLDVVLATARAMDVPMPITAGVRQNYAAMASTGRGELDFCALVMLAEELAGLKLD